jgi:hypothetical protein
MANQVTLTIAGESRGAEDAFARVGSSAKDMDDKVRQSGDSFDRVRDKADDVDTKAMGFRDTLTGIQDGTEGVKRAAAGDWGFETLLLIGFGIGDLASGMVNFLIPALKGTRLAQLGLNFAFLTSPLTWIILGIVALVAVIVLIATKTDWFQRIWRNAWGWIKNAAVSSWNLIKSAASNAWSFLSKIPGWTRSAFGKVASFITAPYRAAFNGIARAWNNTVGRLSFTFPGWIPGIGGNSINVPNLPTFHSGGVVPGVVGTAVPIMAQAGERVSGVAGGAGREEWIRVDLGDLGSALIDAIAKGMKGRAGRPAALGIVMR